MSATYFIAYRYSQGGYVVDGNTVMTLDEPIESEDDVRAFEAYLANEKAVSPDEFGLTCVNSLAEDG